MHAETGHGRNAETFEESARAAPRLAGADRREAVRSDASPPPRTIIEGRYRLRERIGAGAMSVVHAADDLVEEREVAIKLLRIRVRDRAAEALIRFRKEAQVLAALSHPGIVRFYGFGELEDGGAFIVMERLHGRPLSAALAAGPLAPDAAAAIAREVAAALAHAHEAGIVHRDLKPANIMLGPDGGVKLLDFGLAQLAEWQGDADVAGTYCYMAPEQAGVLDRPVDARADLYSLGVVLFEMLTGAPPFSARTLSELLHMHVAKRPAAPREVRPDVPPVLEAIALKLLEKDPDDRYQSARGLLRDLGALDEVGAALGAKGPLALDAERRLRGLRREVRLVGREPERAAIRRAVEAAARGVGKVLLIEGPPGIGKTRLLEEVRRATLLREGVFLLGRAETGAPYEPIVQAARARLALLARIEPGAHARAVAALRRELVGWADGLLAAVGIGAARAGAAARTDAEGFDPAHGNASVDAGRLHEAALRILLAFADPERALPSGRGPDGAGAREGTRPVVLAIEDLERADEKTVGVLERLARAGGAGGPLAGATGGLLAVATVSADAAAGTAARLLAGPTNPPRLEVIRLFPLPPEHARELVLAHLRPLGEPAESVVRLIVERGEGMPDAIDKIVRRLVERGGIEWTAHGEIALRPGAADELREAPSRSGALVERALGLDPPVRGRLARIACARRPFTLETAVAAAADDMGPVLEALDAAADAGVVRIDAAAAAWRFADEAARLALQALLSRAERATVHLRLAERLAPLDPGDPEHAPFEVAHHFEAAGRGARAVAPLVEAAELARAVLAFDEARVAFDRALSLVEQDGDGAVPPPLLRRILAGRGDALLALGRYEEAIGSYGRALGLETSSLARCRLAIRMGAAAFRAGDGRRATSYLDEALRALRVRVPATRAGGALSVARAGLGQIAHTLAPGLFRGREGPPPDDERERMRLFRELERIYYFIDVARAVAAHLRGLNLAERYARSRELALFSSSHVVFCGAMGLFDRGRRYGLQALEIAREEGDEALAAEAHLTLGMAASWEGKLEDALAHLERAEAALARRFDPWTAHAARAFAGAALARLGRFEDARRTFESLLQSAREIRDERSVAIALLGLGETAAALAGSDDALPKIEESIAICRRIGDNLFLAQALRALGQAHLARGAPDRAIEPLEASRAAIERSRLAGADVVETYAVLAEALVADLPLLAILAPAERRARFRRARRLARRARRLARRYPSASAAADRAAGKVELAAGRTARGLARLEAAARTARRLGQRALLGRIYADLAAARRALDPRRAELLAAAAQEIFLDLAMKPDLVALGAAFGAGAEGRGPGTGGGGAGGGANGGGKSGSSSSRAALLAEKRKLEALFEVGKTLQESSHDVERLLARIVEVAVEVTGAERGLLFLFERGADGPARAPRPVVVRAINGTPLLPDPTPEALGLSQTVLSDIEARGQAFVLADAAADEALRERRSVIERGLRSILCVPLRARDDAIGFIYLDNRLVRGLFGAREIELVSAFGAQAALAIENARERRELEAANRRLRETQARLVQSAKMSAIGQLAAGVSHEIRNPLNIIGGSIYLARELLRQGAPAARLADCLSHVEAEVQRATGLIDRILDFARPAEAPLEPLDLNEVVERSLALVARVLEKRAIEVVRELAADIPLVQGSAGELEQVVVNIALNGAQAIDAPGGRLTVRTRARDGKAVVEIADTGHGIRAEDMERLFEPFFSRREGGTGLGLYVSYGIVERHGGTIEVDTEVGKGTVFRVVLPAARAPLAAANGGGMMPERLEAEAVEKSGDA